MDSSRNLHELFSRSSTPPIAQSQHTLYPGQHVSPSPNNQIDSLFHNLTSSSDLQQQQQSANQSQQYGPSSEPVTPINPLTDEISSTVSVPASNTAVERQSALLSLLGPSSGSNRGAPPPATLSQQVPQVPTPPGSISTSGPSPSHNETQGKILLEQLMAGNPPRSNYSDSQRSSVPGAPSPPYNSSSTAIQRDVEYRNRENQYIPHDTYDTTSEISQRPQGPPQPPTQQQLPQQQPQPAQPPSPRKSSMFDFVSPFDALASGTSSIKKKPVPAPPAIPSIGNDDQTNSWPAIDPKRQSVDNLLEQITRGPLPVPPTHASSNPYNSYIPNPDFGQSEHVQSRDAPPPPPPLPPKPNRAVSPRFSPPKQQRPQARPAESPAGQVPAPHHPPPSNRRDKESSPGPRGGYRNKGVNQAGKKNNGSPSPPAQSIVFDVSQNLDEIRAERDSVKSTAIALVRQDSVFLPGTTIGATHWVAYAMTRGRVRVISRSSGDRTLLQLPTTFPSTSSITDMAVYGNRLAGVTSDGGFVVWELPELITDDVPGELILNVSPSPNADALHSVKWHPKEPDTLAVASETKIYYIDLANAHTLRGQPLLQADLQHISQVFSVPSPLVAFEFDVPHFSLAGISEDSTLTIWSLHDKSPYATYKVRGEDSPSSLTFIDSGIVVGRKNGTVFQLLSVHTKSVLSTVKFINGDHEDPDMFGHINYDSRIQTLWVANCRRESMIALKLNYDTSVFGGGEETTRPYFEQVVEFGGPKATIHFVILTGDADPNGDEAHAACVAAKVAPGELALVAFSVHSSGVDQVLIRREWYDAALAGAPAKFPPYALPQPPVAVQTVESKARQPAQNPPAPAPAPVTAASNALPPRGRTPPSEEVEGETTRDEGRASEAKPKGSKGKNVNWKEKEDNTKEKDKNAKNNDAAIINDSALGQALVREIRKTEENLHTRIGRLIGKEMDKQHQRLEEARAHEQAEDLTRQEKILKLISTELTRNTTRVVEMAVKSEVQNSVLPALENITKNEVKAALNEQVGRGLVDLISQSLPLEIEKLLLRPDISNHFAHLLSSNLTPLIERNVKEAITKTFIPVYSQQSSIQHQDLAREMRSEIHGVKSDLTTWQSDAFRNQELIIRDLEHSVRSLSEQVKFLSMSIPAGSGSVHHLQQAQQLHSSPNSNTHPQQNLNQTHLRQNLPAPNQAPNYQSHASFQQPQQPSIHGPWFGPAIAAPQASHPAALPQPPAQQPPPPPPQQQHQQQQQQQQQRTPPIKPEQWDDIYLAVLHTEDAAKLRDLLAQTNPEVIMPLHAPSLVSQAVVLTLVHRLSAVVGETLPTDESFKTSLWWLQRAVTILNPMDKLITDFIPRVVPNVQHLLNTTKQRLTILPGGPLTLETSRTVTDIQETLRRKVLPVS